MSKEEDIYFDDDQFDAGEFDFSDDPLSFSFEEPVDDRKPVDAVADGLKEGAIESLTDEYKLRELAEKALPKEYSTAARDVGQIKRALEVPAQQMSSEVRKELINLKRSTNKLAPTIRRTFGDKIGDTFDRFTKVEDKTSDSDIQISEEDASVASALSSTFGAALEQINAKRNEESVESSTLEIIRNKEGKKQFSVTADLQSRMATGIEALVNYNNQIDVQYKRTDIELGQRQLFTLRKILEVNTESASGMVSELKAITKNTALPDILKQKLSENFSQISEDKLIGRVHEKAHDVAGGYLNKMIQNGVGLAREKVDEIKGVAGQIADMVESYATMSDMEAEMAEMEGSPQEDKRTRAIKTVSKMVAGMGLSKAGEAAAYRFLKYLEKNPTAIKIAGNLDYYSNNKGAVIDDFIQSNQTESGFKGLLARGLGRIAPSLSSDREEILNNTVEDATEAVSWDLLSRKTLVEIIPAWFSKLEQNQRIALYGEGQSALTFDHGTDKFTTMEQAASRAKGQLLSSSKKESMLEQSNELVDLLDKDGKLTPTQRQALQRSFLENADNSMGFAVNQLAEGRILTDNISNEDAGAIIDLARERFALEDGDKGFVLKDEEAIKLRNKMASAFSRLSMDAPDIQEQINRYQKVGGKDILRNAGLIVDNDEGKDKFNHRAFYDQYFADAGTDSQGTVGGRLRQAGFPTPTPPIPLGGANLTTAAEQLKEPAKNYWTYTDQQSFLDKLLNGFNAQQEAQVKEDRERTQDEAESPYEPILTRFDDANVKLDDVNQQLLVIAGILQEGITINDGESSSSGGLKGILSNMKLQGKGLAGKAKNFFMGGLKRMDNLRKLAFKPITIAKDLAGKGLGMAKSGLQAAQGLISGGVSDIYLTGDKEPRLLAEDIRNGRYIDVKTGLVIKSIKDITGAVVDLDGNFILTDQQFLELGIEERGGLMRKAKGAMRDMVRRATDVMTLPATVTAALLKGGGQMLSGAKEKVEELLNKARDIYVRGESEPRLKKHIMEANGYIDKTTGKVIRSLKDITGDVMDLDGNIILTAKDISDGLFDVTGAKIRLRGMMGTIGEKAVEMAGRMKDAAMLPFRLAGRGLSELRKLFESKALKSLFLNLPDDIILKANVVHLYTDSLNTVRSKVKGDVSGDGVRDGSWQDQMAKAKAEKEAGAKTQQPKEKKTQEKSKKSSGFPGLELLTGFAGKILKKVAGVGALFTTLGSVFTSGIGGVVSALSAGFKAVVGALTARKVASTMEDVTDISSDKDKSKDKKGKKTAKSSSKTSSKTSKPKGGKFSKVMGGATKGASTAGSTAAKTASTASKGGLVKTVARGAMTVGSAALGFISAPIALGALAVISIGVAGYYLWGWYTRRKDIGELERMRFIQYGANESSENVKVNIRYLEGELIGKVQAMNGAIDIPLTAEEVWNDYASDFGFKQMDVDGMYSWANWYNTRFKPVFLTWVAAASGFTGKDGDAISFASVDSDLQFADRLDFIKATMFDGGQDDPYAVEGLVYNSSPTTYFRKDVEAYLAELTTKYSSKPKPLTPQAKETTSSSNVVKAPTAYAAMGSNAYQSQPQQTSYGYRPPSPSLGGSMSYKPAATATATVVPFSAKKDSLPMLTSIEKIRFYQYGANLQSAQHLNSLIALETLLAHHITLTDKEVKLDITLNEVLDKVGGAFGIVEGDSVRTGEFKAWFNYRFLPIFNRFVRILAQSNTDLVKYKRKMRPEDEIALIYNSLAGRLDTAEGHTPFESSFSPWPDYEMPTNPHLLADRVTEEVDLIQKTHNIKQEVEDNANLNRMREFVAQSKAQGEIRGGEMPTVGMFGQDTPKSKQDYRNAIDLTKLGSYKTEAVKLGNVNGGDVAPHNQTDKVEKRIATYNDIIAAASEKYGVDQHLIRSVIRQESAGNPEAVSPVGAVGLMQFMPATAKDMGIVDRTDPTQNIFGGAKYLRILLDRYDNNVELALAAYNAGMGNVDKAVKAAGSTNGGMVLAALPTITGRHAKETQGYVTKITSDYAGRTNQQAGMKGVDFSTTHTTKQETRTTAAMATVPTTSNVGTTTTKEGTSGLDNAQRTAARSVDTPAAQNSPDYTMKYQKAMLDHTETMAKTLTRIEKLLLEQKQERQQQAHQDVIQTATASTGKAKDTPQDIYASPEDALPVSMRKTG